MSYRLEPIPFSTRVNELPIQPILACTRDTRSRVSRVRSSNFNRIRDASRLHVKNRKLYRSLRVLRVFFHSYTGLFRLLGMFRRMLLFPIFIFLYF